MILEKWTRWNPRIRLPGAYTHDPAGNIVTNPDGTHFAYTSMCGDMIRFFDCSREDHEPVETACLSI